MTRDDLCGAHIDLHETESAIIRLVSMGARPLITDNVDLGDIMSVRKGESVVLWKAEEKLFGKRLPTWIQQTGVCVWMGFIRAVTDTIYNALAFGDLMGDKDFQIAGEFSYAVSRKIIGNLKLRYDDGSCGAWMAEGMYSYGLLLRKIYGKDNLTRQDENWAKQHSIPGGQEISKDLYRDASDYQCDSMWCLQTVDEVKAAIRSMRGIARCADRATSTKRGKDGVARLVKSGGHCQCWRGLIIDIKGNEYVVEQQSWPLDSAPNGGNDKITLQTGEVVTLPEGSAMIPMEDVQYCLRYGEVWAADCPTNLWSSK